MISKESALVFILIWSVKMNKNFDGMENPPTSTVSKSRRYEPATFCLPSRRCSTSELSDKKYSMLRDLWMRSA